MTQKEMNPRLMNVMQASDRELARITLKYQDRPLPDDGRSDSLAFAVTQHRYAKENRIGFEARRWLSAILLATQSHNTDWKLLKFEIRDQAQGFLDIAEGDTKDDQTGKSLLNLADSI